MAPERGWCDEKAATFILAIIFPLPLPQTPITSPKTSPSLCISLQSEAGSTWVKHKRALAWTLTLSHSEAGASPFSSLGLSFPT